MITRTSFNEHFQFIAKGIKFVRFRIQLFQFLRDDNLHIQTRTVWLLIEDQRFRTIFNTEIKALALFKNRKLAKSFSVKDQ